METKPEFFLGIDPTGGRSSYTWATLDEQCHLICLEEGELEDILAYIEKLLPMCVAINGASNTNLGLVHTRLLEEKLGGGTRGADIRLSEFQLRERGIQVPPTPSRLASCSTWTQMGINLHTRLEQKGYKQFLGPGKEYQRLEVNAHATFCALLQQVPLPKPTLEGRIQRQLVLFEHGANITDPMDFFEEITRHRILRGSMPMEYIYASNELDTLAAAFVAWYVNIDPEGITKVGDREEGEIVLPVHNLEEKYN